VSVDSQTSASPSPEADAAGETRQLTFEITASGYVTLRDKHSVVRLTAQELS
jgi:hypothetical protein